MSPYSSNAIVLPNVLNNLLNKSGMSLTVVVNRLKFLNLDRDTFKSWLTGDLRIPGSYIRHVADALNVTVQKMFSLPDDVLIDMSALDHGRLIVYDNDSYTAENASKSEDDLVMNSRPPRRELLQFGMDGMVMGPTTRPKVTCSCGRSVG